MDKLLYGVSVYQCVTIVLQAVHMDYRYGTREVSLINNKMDLLYTYRNADQSPIPDCRNNHTVALNSIFDTEINISTCGLEKVA